MPEDVNMPEDDKLPEEAETPPAQVVEAVTAATPNKDPREQLIADLKELAAEAKIPSENYANIGIQFFKLNLILEYLKLLENAKNPEPEPQPANAALTEGRVTTTRSLLKTRLEERKTDLIEKLRLSCWEALQAARLLLDELRCNTFPEDLVWELTDNPQRVEIKSNPPAPVLNEPTELSVWFHRKDYERAAARDELFCCWKFLPARKSGWRRIWSVAAAIFGRNEVNCPDERGWNVWHVFGDPGSHEVEVRFRDAAGRSVPNNGEEVVVRKTFKIAKIENRWYLRFNIEMLQFLVSLVVVVVALMAGAMEKIQELDNLRAIGTLIGIGFAANTVKNLITPPNSKP